MARAREMKWLRAAMLTGVDVQVDEVEMRGEVAVGAVKTEVEAERQVATPRK